MTDYDREIQSMLDELQDMIGLTPWQEDFLDSLRDQTSRGRILSLKQEDILRDIYKKHC